MYVKYNPNPNQQRTGDCVVRAIAKVTGKSWERVYLELVAQGFVMGAMPSENDVWGEYLHNMGFSRHVIPDTCPNCYTVRDFAYDHPRGEYILSTGSHAIAVVSGDYFDSWDSGSEIPIFYWRY